jgi:hypothetical protein
MCFKNHHVEFSHGVNFEFTLDLIIVWSSSSRPHEPGTLSFVLWTRSGVDGSSQGGDEAIYREVGCSSAGSIVDAAPRKEYGNGPTSFPAVHHV